MDTEESKIKIVSVNAADVFITVQICCKCFICSQLVNVIFMALVLVPQFYVMGRPKSSRYCQQPLLNNLSAFVALSFVASGFSVIFTLIDPVPQSFRAAYHVFGLLSFSQGLCTTILTLTAAACAHTTPELYYLSVSLTAACTFATAFFLVKGGLWITKLLCRPDPSQGGATGLTPAQASQVDT